MSLAATRCAIVTCTVNKNNAWIEASRKAHTSERTRILLRNATGCTRSPRDKSRKDATLPRPSLFLYFTLLQVLVYRNFQCPQATIPCSNEQNLLIASRCTIRGLIVRKTRFSAFDGSISR